MLKKACVVCGLSLPYKLMFYFEMMRVPLDETQMKIWQEDCMFCEGVGCQLCDNSGKMDIFDWTGETKDVEYWECPFHFGIFWAFWHWLAVRPVRFIKGWIH